MQNKLFSEQTAFYKGKVRDVYTINNRLLVMIASNRISAFDVILPRPIPYKGQVLNQVAARMLKSTADICPNWLLDVPAPNARDPLADAGVAPDLPVDGVVAPANGDVAPLAAPGTANGNDPLADPAN